MSSLITGSDVAFHLKIEPMPRGREGTYLEEVAQTATRLVKDFCGKRVEGVPVEVLRLAALETAGKIKAFRDAPNGVSNWNDFDAAPIRLTSDPLIIARRLLSPYISRGFA